MIKPNFSEEQSFKMLEPGIYNFKILGCEQGTSSKSNHQYVKWELEEVKSRQKVNYVTMIEGRAVGMFRHFIKSAGIENYDDSDIDEAEVIGNFVSCKIKHKQYPSTRDGSMKTRLEVESVSTLN
jgi:hypothetical protein